MRVFRKSISAVALILAVAGAAKSSHATVLLSDGFDSDTTGKLPGSPFSGYENAATGSASSNVVSDTSNFFGAGATNHILSINDTSSTTNTYAQAINIANATTVETLSFNYYEPTETGAGSPLYVFIGAGTGVGSGTSTQVIDYQLNDGSIGTSNSYSLDTLHLIQIVANNSSAPVAAGDGSTTVQSKQAAIFVDGQLKANYGVNSGQTTPVGTALNDFAFYSYTSSANQQSYIDNVQLVDFANAPEPTGLCAMLVAGGAGLMRRRRAWTA